MPRYTPEQVVDFTFGPPPTGAEKKLADLRKKVPPPEKPPSETSPELREIIDRETRKLQEFFGLEVFNDEIREVPPLPPEVTPERVREWRELGFELHYLPEITMAEDRDFPGWRHKPGKRYTPGQQYGLEFYDEIKNGNLAPDSATLPGSWILADSREKPDYQNGKQLYPNDDQIGAILKDLREQGIIQAFDPPTSRFNLSWDELHSTELTSRLASLLGVPPDKLRLPRAIEWNYLGNAFHPQWGTTNTWEWLEDSYQGGRRRMRCGGSRGGGLSGVYWNVPGDRYGYLGFRRLVVLS